MRSERYWWLLAFVFGTALHFVVSKLLSIAFRAAMGARLLSFHWREVLISLVLGGVIAYLTEVSVRHLRPQAFAHALCIAILGCVWAILIQVYAPRFASLIVFLQCFPFMALHVGAYWLGKYALRRTLAFTW